MTKKIFSKISTYLPILFLSLCLSVLFFSYSTPAMAAANECSGINGSNGAMSITPQVPMYNSCIPYGIVSGYTIHITSGSPEANGDIYTITENGEFDDTLHLADFVDVVGGESFDLYLNGEQLPILPPEEGELSTTSLAIYSTGLNSMILLFQGLLAYALANWIPVMISIIIIIGIITWFAGKSRRLFGGKK